VHSTVTGTAADGTPYDARDPELLRWVWATLVEGALLLYTRYVHALGFAEVAAYYGEQKRFGLACGVPASHLPETYDDFVRYVDGTIGRELAVTDAARDVARATLHPAVPLPARPAFEALNLVTVGLLPSSVRVAYELPWGPRRERALAASTGVIRRTLPLLPALVREFPPARAASRRTRTARRVHA
jgi:uncharacterized protein (DUF2236 family)